MTNVGAHYDEKRHVIVSDLGEVIATDVRIVQTYLSRLRYGGTRPIVFARCLVDTIQHSVTIYPESKKAVVHL